MSTAAAAREVRRHPRPDRGPLFVAAAIAALPLTVLLALALSATGAPTEDMRHLFEHVVPGVLLNTVVLVFGVTLLAGLLGTALAWLVSTYDFPLRSLFAWALLLPMAIPAYVLAFVAIAGLDFAGPVQTALRGIFGPDLRLPPIRSTGGVILVMSLALYPYVYLLARGAFATQGRRALEVAASLGLTPRQSLLRVQLPMARPWIAGGMALVAMETLADFGTVAVFNYDTFTTAIWRAWSALYSIEAALQLAGLLVLLVAVALAFEQRAQAAQRHTALGGSAAPRLRLRGWRAAAATALPASVLLSALLLPGIALLSWAARHAAEDLDADWWAAAGRSMALGLMAAALVCTLAIALAYAVRVRSDPVTRGLARIATLGYALPGTVLAVGVFVPMAGLNNLLESAARAVGGDWPGYLQGSVAVLLLAYAVRFLAVGHAPIEANLGRITPRIDDGARLLGATGFALLRRVHLPLLRTGLLTAAVLVLVAVIGAAIVAEWERLPGFIAAVGAACLAFNLLSMAVGYGLPRLLNLPRSQAIAISMEIGIHNGTLAIFIALTVLQNATMSVPAAVYSIIMFVTAGAFTFWLNRGR